MVFILGMITMWVICGLIALIINSLTDNEDLKDMLVGGFWWVWLAVIINKLRKPKV